MSLDAVPPGPDAAPADAAAPLVMLQGLRKRHGDVPVFDGVDLEVRAGEFVAVLGESGVGKSTLLNCIAGLDRVDAGHVTIAGTALAGLDETAQAHFRREHLGFVFQAFHVLPHLTVAQNVALPLMLIGRASAAEQRRRVDEALAAVGLDTQADRLPQTLSGGQLQRVAIARAVVHRPRLILADEPTGNLDPRTAERVMDVLADQVRAHGSACLLVTHSSAAAARADRVVALTSTGVVHLPSRPSRPVTGSDAWPDPRPGC
jgi:putative ABC transport system ATP-binding protein